MSDLGKKISFVRDFDGIFKAIFYILGFFCIGILTSCKVKYEKAEAFGASGYFQEKHRPQYHFSPVKNWMNDPNGLVFQDGEYHLFYQYYPDSNVWGPMHWGHAVSKDLIFWYHLPVALEPDSLGWIFSGSAVVDDKNSSGLGYGKQSPMVVFYTYHNDSLEKNKSLEFQYQGMAYSLDRGRTFQKFYKNPVVTNPGIRDFRDPKVIWYEPEQKWVMLLAAYDKILFYQSKDLKSWEETGQFGNPGDKRLWECPDLISLKDPESGVKKWVLLVSMTGGPNGGTATSYYVGDFDGNTFLASPGNQKWLDYGTDNYALVTWSKPNDSRTLAIGWMSNWQYAQQVPTEVWRSAMTLPRELSLYKLNQEYFVSAMPVREINRLKKMSRKEICQPGETKWIDIPELAVIEWSGLYPDSSKVLCSFENEKMEKLVVGYDHDKRAVYLDRTQSGNVDFHPSFSTKQFSSDLPGSDSLNISFYLDRASLEMMINNKISMTQIFFPEKPYSKMKVYASRGIQQVVFSEMSSIWSK